MGVSGETDLQRELDMREFMELAKWIKVSLEKRATAKLARAQLELRTMRMRKVDKG
jgi:hypothetical protein